MVQSIRLTLHFFENFILTMTVANARVNKKQACCVWLLRPICSSKDFPDISSFIIPAAKPIMASLPFIVSDVPVNPNKSYKNTTKCLLFIRWGLKQKFRYILQWFRGGFKYLFFIGFWNIKVWFDCLDRSDKIFLSLQSRRKFLRSEGLCTTEYGE